MHWVGQNDDDDADDNNGDDNDADADDAAIDVHVFFLMSLSMLLLLHHLLLSVLLEYHYHSCGSSIHDGGLDWKWPALSMVILMGLG